MCALRKCAFGSKRWLPCASLIPFTGVMAHRRSTMACVSRWSSQAHFFVSTRRNGPTAFTSEDVDEYVRCYSNPDVLRAGFEYYRSFPRNEQRMKEYGKHKLQMLVLALGAENGGGGFPFYSLAQVAEHVSCGIILKSGHFP